MLDQYFVRTAGKVLNRDSTACVWAGSFVSPTIQTLETLISVLLRSLWYTSSYYTKSHSETSWSHPDSFQKSVFHTRQRVLVSQYWQVLCLSLELLVGVNTGSEHLCSSPRAHLPHLLRHLTSSCRALGLRTKSIRVQVKHTIVAPKQVVEHWLQPENTQHIPRNGRHPLRIHIPRANACLQHALKLNRQRERQSN